MDDNLGEYIAKGVAVGLLIMVVVFGLIVFIYNVSGAKDRDENRKLDCISKGGEMLFSRDTGNLCIKGVIKLEG